MLRLEYGTAAVYSELTLRARAAWRQIEQATGADLYREVGVLFLVPEGDDGSLGARKPRGTGPSGRCRQATRPRRNRPDVAVDPSRAMTPTEDPVIDRLADGRIVCAGFSGHGFKFAPVLAPAVAELALGHEPSSDLRSFRR